MIINGDDEIPEYPEWIEVKFYKTGDYATGMWTRKGAFVYAIVSTLSAHFSYELAYRYASGQNRSTAWRQVPSSDYDKLFKPGEIDSLMMELLL